MMMNHNDEPYLHRRRGCIFGFITALARISALITVLGLVFVTYLEWLKIGSSNFRIYVTIVTIIVAYLEVLWILDKLVTCCFCCFRSESCLYWICCIPVDNWLKAIIYIGLAIPFFVPTRIFSVTRTDIKTVGALLVITGLIYFVKTFKYKTIDPDDIQEDDNLFDTSNQPSISTQTSVMGINNDNLSSTLTVEQETNKKH